MRLIFLLTLILCFKVSFSQTTINVTEQTIKISGTSESQLHYGFAAGDKVIINFNEMNGKDLKEFEVIEYPSNSRFSEYKVSSISDKSISINKECVLIFRLKNGAIGGRVCKMKIQRVPASNEQIGYNSNVQWVNKQDTIWNSFTKDVVVGYDTVYSQKIRKVLDTSKKEEILLIDKVQRVHSIMSSSGYRARLMFSLPLNIAEPLKTKKVISWAYWVGVGEESNIAWKQNAQNLSKLSKAAASYFVTPLGALAVGALTNLLIPQTGEDIAYFLTDKNNSDLFLAGHQFYLKDQGKGIAGYKVFTDVYPLERHFFICLANDNQVMPVDVNVKVVALIEESRYKEENYTEQIINTIIEKKIFKEPTVVTNRVPMCIQ